jgi:hypothetical protein
MMSVDTHYEASTHTFPCFRFLDLSTRITGTEPGSTDASERRTGAGAILEEEKPMAEVSNSSDKSLFGEAVWDREEVDLRTS